MGIEGISIEERNSIPPTIRDDQNPSKYSTHFNVFFQIKVPCAIISENQIKADKVDASILKHQLVTIGKSGTQEQIITDKKLLFDGLIVINLNLNCSKKGKKLYGVKKKVFFNHFISVPFDADDEFGDKLECSVEDVTYSQLKRRKLNVTIALFVEYCT